MVADTKSAAAFPALAEALPEFRAAPSNRSLAPGIPDRRAIILARRQIQVSFRPRDFSSCSAKRRQLSAMAR
jgi:hypothetical protein